MLVARGGDRWCEVVTGGVRLGLAQRVHRVAAELDSFARAGVVALQDQLQH